MSTGSLADVRHVVVFMQENRSFDHYYGTLRGVRGFGDRTAIALPDGGSVFRQRSGRGAQYPWRLTNDEVRGQALGQCNGELDHSWATQQKAFGNGRMDSWIAAKGSVRTMGYLARADIPFHYALADAYTILDAYHCSVLSATGPNRTYLWSGWIDPDGTAGGPAYDGGDESGLSWPTYAEELSRAGITWKVYQSYDNYGDNALEYFRQFQDLPQSSPRYPGVARVPGSEPGTGDIATLITDGMLADLKAGAFPQVCWIVPSQEYSEHPHATPQDGARFISMVLQALAGYPDVFDSTVIFLNYDENDGLFDHVPPPVPEPGTAGEYIAGSDPATAGLPIGLGFRVPMTIISPWSRGGYVSSELADHTSVLQFLERWSAAIGKPARCPHISAWRREVCSDLTGMFDFASPVYGLPSALPAAPTVIGMAACALLPNPSPATSALPAQEPGTRPARALPYQAGANAAGFGPSATSEIAISVELSNTGAYASSGAHFWVYANTGNPDGPWPYTVGVGATRTVSVDIGAGRGAGAYSLTVLGPNRFRRDFAGHASTAGAAVEAAVACAEDVAAATTGLVLTLTSSLPAPATFTITACHYASGTLTVRVPAGGSWQGDITATAASGGWYDCTVTVDADSSWSRRFTGHLENGQVSSTG